MKFISLHNHYDTSPLDGMSSIDKMILKAKEYGANSLGISDHGNMIGCLDFYRKCTKADIKPIIGCEFYMGESESQDNFHLCLFAYNDIGIKNLYKLNSFGALFNYYRKPRINREMLKKCSEGLICTTACIGGELGQLILNSKDILETYLFFKNTFKDLLFIELQPNSLSEQRKFNMEITKLLPNEQYVVCLDCHYVDKDDAETHDTLLALQINKRKNDKNRFRFSCNDFYYMSVEEIMGKLDYLDENFVKNAIENTNKIADLCFVNLENDKELLPKIENDKDILAKLCNEGFKRRLKSGRFNVDVNEVVKRIQYELKIICDKGYASYFLIVDDFHRFCDEKHIMRGCGRGSVAGSEVAFILGYTEVEPIEYGLLFERFLNPERITAPDVDEDLCYFRRSELINYILEKYGQDKVASIIAKATFAFKKTIVDVLRTYDVETSYINAIKKKIPEECNSITELKTLNMSLIDEFNGIDKRIVTDMEKLEGLMSHVSKHAAGIVISPTPIYDTVPCTRDSDNHNMYLTQWDKKEVESLKLFKFDLLGLKLLTIFDKTLQNIKKNKGITITREELFSIDLKDKKLYETLNSGNTNMVFQFEGNAGSKTIKDVKPKCFEDIIACESICRPGVKDAQLYIDNKKSYMENGTFSTPSYWDKVKHILEPTYGAIVYQEQTMMLFHDIGGYTLGEADKLRKVKDLEVERERFVSNAMLKGFTREESDELFNTFDLGYSFNKSHAAVYGLNSMVCCYLLTYHKAEYIAACLTLELTKVDNKIIENIKIGQKNNIVFRGVDINKSTNEFEVDGENIILPLNCIDGISGSKIDFIDKIRPIKSFKDFLNKIIPKNINKTNGKKLIMAGAFDCFDKNRTKLLEEYSAYIGEKNVIYPFYCDEVQIQYEKNSMNFSLTKHELDGVINIDICDLEDGFVTINAKVVDLTVKKDKKGNDMAFLKLENKYCCFDGLMFSFNYRQYKSLIFVGAKLTIIGTKEGNKVLIKNVNVL